MSVNVRANRLPSFPSIRIVDISPFHLPVRGTRVATSAARRARDQRAESAASLFFGAAAAARGAAVGF